MTNWMKEIAEQNKRERDNDRIVFSTCAVLAVALAVLIVFGIVK